MSLRQSLMKAFYPIIRKVSEAVGSKATIASNTSHTQPLQSFYSLNATGITGQPISFDQFKGKKVLLVNTASACGFTGQLDELQKLQDQCGDKLVVLGFPANDFKNQESGNNEDIASFCKINYGVTFHLVQKTSVVKSASQHPVYQWLSDKNKNGWNEVAPDWNFGKYLVDENGVLLNYFGTAISPLSEDVVSKVQL